MLSFAARIMDGIHNSPEGGTVHPKGHSPTTGYMVGGKAWTLTTVADNLDSYVVLDYLKAHESSLTWDTTYVGWWTHNGRIYLDIADNVSNLETAKILGMHRKEIAVWDVQNAREITL